MKSWAIFMKVPGIKFHKNLDTIPQVATGIYAGPQVFENLSE
jgi:hypothetical protein